MKLKLYQLENVMMAENGQLSVLGKLFKQDLPIKDAWNVSGVIRKITPEHEKFLENRNKLILKHGTLTEGTKDKYKFEGENAENFAKESDELLGTEVEIDIIKIKISSLEDKNISMSPGEMNLLEWLFE